ncbi:hypothetical protein HV824_31165, partial [Myxococcus sp. AM009]|nr:hypothetical protein [Myxococcus sp. AM009]
MHLFDIPAWLEVAWPHVVAALTVLISTVASAHAAVAPLCVGAEGIPPHC